MIYGIDSYVKFAVSDRQYELYERISRINKEQGLRYRKISAFFNASGVTTIKRKRWSKTDANAVINPKQVSNSETSLQSHKS